MTLVAIHQPNFFPWMGFFNKIWRCDRFIVLDDVQLQKTGGSWVNRVRLGNKADDYWVTAPIERAHSGVRTIAEVRLDNSRPWRKKLLTTIEQHYGRAAHFASVYETVRPLVEFDSDRLLDYNIHALKGVMVCLEMDLAKLVFSSSLKVQSSGTQRLVDLVSAVGGVAYLSGSYAMETYQEPRLFEQAGLALVAQNFHHPIYARPGRFLPGLSLLDALFHCGAAETRRLLQDASS